MVMGIFTLSFYTAQNIDAYDLFCVFCFRVVFFLKERKLSCSINVDQFTFYIGVFLHYWYLLMGAFKWSILPWKKIPLETWSHHLRATHANGEHWKWQLCPLLPVYSGMVCGKLPPWVPSGISKLAHFPTRPAAGWEPWVYSFPDVQLQHKLNYLYIPCVYWYR